MVLLITKAKKLEKIMIVDNKEKTVAGEEEPSHYNSSTIDNNSAFTQPRGRDAIQPIQKEQDEDVLEGDDDGHNEGARTRSQESEEEASWSLPIKTLNTYRHQLKSNLQYLRKDMKK